ncbi:hypothetical protein C4D60_Mb04t29120 [Musa balbisiana]|uniref:Uncharacterized protein n=1 Tax=Musa balbisiana TaxID=52838 RepID=A0A4V4HA45_MUSBA|nr:hypothetical protein C4D60_Mb04t29120 [Musa balbisiana]
MAMFLLSLRQKFSANPSFTIRTCSFWVVGAFQSLERSRSLSSPASDHSHMTKLPQIIPSGRDNLGNGFRIEVVDTDFVGVSYKLLDQIDGGTEALSSSLKINDETCSCSSAALAEESLDFDEIEDLRLRKKLFYKLDKGSKEFEECNIQFHHKKSAKKRHERTTEADIKKEFNDLEKKKNQKVIKSNAAKASEQGVESRLIKNVRSCTKSTVMEEKRVRMPTINQLTDPYHLPFCLDIYISKGSVRACIVHRITSKVVAVAHSISKDMKFDLKSRKDATACAAVGAVLAQRAIEDDIHNVVYTPRKWERIEGKIQIVLQSIIDHGIDVKVKLKQKQPSKVKTCGYAND